MKVSLELPIATRHRIDMTEKLVKATLNTNKQNINNYMRKGLFAKSLRVDAFFTFFCENESA